MRGLLSAQVWIKKGLFRLLMQKLVQIRMHISHNVATEIKRVLDIVLQSIFSWCMIHTYIPVQHFFFFIQDHTTPPLLILMRDATRQLPLSPGNQESSWRDAQGAYGIKIYTANQTEIQRRIIWRKIKIFAEHLPYAAWKLAKGQNEPSLDKKDASQTASDVEINAKKISNDDDLLCRLH